jgi:hypothetical protein
VSIRGRSVIPLGVSIVLLASGWQLWALHARFWNEGWHSSVLGYDAGQYAVAARELAEHGRLATPFALPIELAWHPDPPWPLAAVEPGLLVIEASVQALAPSSLGPVAQRMLWLDTPGRRERLALVFPFTCYLALGVALALLAANILARHTPQAPALERAAGATVVGGAFLLDPAAQQLAMGGSPHLPFTFGVVAALAMVGSGWASRHVFVFGLWLGLTGSFRAAQPWFGPLLALAAVLATPPKRTPLQAAVAFTLCLVGFALPLVPWWLYKWRAFGSPIWDLWGWTLWDGIQGNSWFSILHLPEPPRLPGIAAAPGLWAAKWVRGLPALVGLLAAGPGLFWIASTTLWLAARRGARPSAFGAGALLALAALCVGSTALGLPWSRDLFPVRIALEAAGLLTAWALVGRLPSQTLGPGGGRALRLAVALLALGWGGLQTARGNHRAGLVAARSGSPAPAMLEDLTRRLSRELPSAEPLMSNLGPSLAWYARRPVLDLALTPSDVEACRQKLPFQHVVLAFRDAAQVWSGWREPFERPRGALAHPEWNLMHARRWQTADGFRVVWLELGPPREQLALRTKTERHR